MSYMAPTFRNNRGGKISHPSLPLIPFLTPLRSLPPPLPSLPSFPCPLQSHPLSHPLSFPLPFSCSYPYPLNTARGSGERCKLPSRCGQSRGPAAKRFWYILGLKSAKLLSFDSDGTTVFSVSSLPW